MNDEVVLWVKRVLETTPSRWIELTKGLPEDLLKLPPADQEWSALQCLLHLIDTERWVFPVRINHLLNEEDFPAFNPDREGTKSGGEQSFQALAEEFARLRQESLGVLIKVTQADLVKRGRHQELGPVTLSELLHEWAAHDLMHTVQAEQALMQPFIRGSGPWEVYFRLHDARQKSK